MMPRIIPISELKNTADISDKCHQQDEPIYITKNGYGDMVIMSMEVYEKMIKKLEIYKDIEISEKQMKEGKVRDARQSLNEMRAKYGL